MMFEGTARYYRDFRPSVPPDVAGTVVERVPALDVLLDLGTGTGQVIAALGPYVRKLAVGVEPDPDMLATAGEALAGREWRAALELCPGTAEEVDFQRWPAADAVTICRAFHWMDQPVVMAKARRHLRPGGLFVVMGDGSLWRDDLAWTVTVVDVVKKYLGARRRAGRSTFEHHTIPYAEVLASGGFRDVHVVNHRFERTWTPEQLLGYLYSTSFSARALYGDRLAEFEVDLLATVRTMAQDRPLTEDVNFELVMGYR